MLLKGTRGPERVEGDGQTKRGDWRVREGEMLALFSTSLLCFKRKKRRKKEEKKTRERNKISGQRKRRAHKRQIETRKERK